MKSNTIIALIFLTLMVCSHAIQIKETSSLNRRHRRHRAARALSASKVRAMVRGELWDAIKDIFNKEDFRFTLGAVLTLLEKVEFPYSITLFHNDEGNWDWTYSPKTEKEVSDAANQMKQSDLKSVMNKYTDGNTLAQIIYDAAEDAALGFIKDLIAKVAKAILVAIFPPIAPIFAVWCLINESGVYATKDEEDSKNGKVIYNVGYTYELINKYGAAVNLFVEIRVNFGKISALIDKWKQQLVDFIKEQYEKFVPPAVRAILGSVASAVAAVGADCLKMYEQLKEGYLALKKMIVETAAKFIEAVKSTKVGQWIVKGVSCLAEAAQWVITEVSKYWSKFSNYISNLSKKVVNALKDTYAKAKDWVKNTTGKVWGWMKSWWRRRMSYRRVFRIANRRYFNNLRRLRRQRNSKY